MRPSAEGWYSVIGSTTGAIETSGTFICQADNAQCPAPVINWFYTNTILHQ